MTENFALYLGGQADAGSVERRWVFGVGSNHGSIKRFIVGAPPGSGWEGEGRRATGCWWKTYGKMRAVNVSSDPAATGP